MSRRLTAKDYGNVSALSLEKLTYYLENIKGKSILCMHHHLHPTNSFMDEYITQNYAYVMELLEQYAEKIKFVISGHTHNYNHYLKNEINYIHAPSSSLGFKKENNQIFSLKKSQFLSFTDKMELIDASHLFEKIIEKSI